MTVSVVGSDNSSHNAHFVSNGKSFVKNIAEISAFDKQTIMNDVALNVGSGNKKVSYMPTPYTLRIRGIFN